jgi:hypothetical protein
VTRLRSLQGSSGSRFHVEKKGNRDEVDDCTNC